MVFPETLNLYCAVTWHFSFQRTGAFLAPPHIRNEQNPQNLHNWLKKLPDSDVGIAPTPKKFAAGVGQPRTSSFHQKQDQEETAGREGANLHLPAVLFRFPNE